MNSLILVVALSFSTPAPEAQTQDEQAIDRVLERVDSVGQSVSSALETVAEKLGTTVDYLWPTYVKRVKARAVTGVVGGIIGLLVGVALFVFFYRRMSAEKKYRVDLGYSKTTDDENFYAALTIIVPGVCLIIGCLIIGSYLCDLIVPEPQALEDLTYAIRLIKG